jgi:ribonucleotide reductase alpha subunit
MGWIKVTSNVFKFILDHPVEANAYYYSTKQGCKGIYYKDKEAVLKVCKDPRCQSCGELVRDHTLS